MVGVAQLVELRIVIPVVAGSNPVAHPRLKVRPGRGIGGVRGKRFAGTNPVAHPTVRMRTGKRGATPIQQTCESGGIGRRAGFRYQYRKM